MTQIAFTRIYGSGSIEVDAQVLQDFGLESSASELMLRLGLPSRLPGDVPIVQFEVPRILEMDGTKLLAIAEEPWGEDLFLCLSQNGEVLSVGDGGRQVVNDRLSSFLGFLEAYEAFQAEAKAEDIAPVVYSQAEMQAKLEAFKRGEILKRSAKPKFDRTGAIKAMVSEWKALDPVAVKGGSWWSVVLEQIQDGLI
ncbi:MAG: SUKH-4 family immunity protein [Stenotrophomonas sp.]